MKIDKVTFRSDWLELISALPVQEQQRLCYAILLRMFGKTVPDMTVRARRFFDIIERDISFCEKQRKNIEKRWQNEKSGTIPRTVPSTIPSTVPRTVPNPAETTGNEGAGAHPSEARPTPVSAPARADNTAHAQDINNININNINNTERNIKREKKILKKESVNPEFSELFPQNLRCPEMLNKWDEWLKYRRSKRKAVSLFAAKRQINMLAGLPLLEALASIEQSIANDYQGLFPPRRGAVPPKQPGRDYSGI